MFAIVLCTTIDRGSGVCMVGYSIMHNDRQGFGCLYSGAIVLLTWGSGVSSIDRELLLCTMPVGEGQ